MKKNIKINHELCTGCGTCTLLAPSTFSFNKDERIQITQKNCDSTNDIKSAVDSCPNGALSLR